MAAVINIADARPGASPDEWQHLDLVLGLTADLLPVVSNPRATIDPESGMKAPGKTPSRYNAQRNAVGFHQWTQHQSTPEEIARWAREKDYGICIQTRRVRAIDIDIDHPERAAAVASAVFRHVGDLPGRTRSNAGKLLLVFECSGELTKRKFKTESGIVEMLASGQQFIACGTHPSGARYEWLDGLPDDIPQLTLDQVNALWSALVEEFATEDSTSQSASVKAQKLSDVVGADPVAQYLLDRSMVKRSERDGRLHITCPFESDHTSDSGDTATTYWPAHTGGYANGHFHCLHAHCDHRTDQEFLDAIEYQDTSLSSEFEAIAEKPSNTPPAQDICAPAAIETVAKPARFAVQPASTFAQGRVPTWMIKGFLPKAELAVLFGESGSGKSFLALDMALDISMGLPWRGRRTKQGRVVYVAAEGVGGVRTRFKAIAQQRGLELDDIQIGVIADAPNMLEKGDALDVAKAIVVSGGADLVIMDTWAQVTAGANENSGEDMGRALAHCKGIHRATGALVLLVHHSGKDSSRGARGWSGLRAAADVELEVLRNDNARSVSVSKLKDGEDGAEFGFHLETVMLGLDEDGDEISSCVVVHNDHGGVSRAKDKGPRGAAQRVVMSAYDDLVGLGSPWVEHEDLVQAAAAQVPREEGKDDRRVETMRRAVNSLEKSGWFVAEKTKLCRKSQKGTS